ncbi:MAG: universal stress protein UspB [Enterobacteriaceae bacterium]
MIYSTALFWGLCLVCLVNMARYYSSLRVLLYVLRGCDPLLYQYVDGPGFFTSHGQPGKQLRLMRYILLQHYRTHFDEEFIALCLRVREQFILSAVLNLLMLLTLIMMVVWRE